MKYSTNFKLKKRNLGSFAWIILTISFFSFTPDRYRHLFFGPGSNFCPVGSSFLEPAFQNSGYLDSVKWTPPADTIVFGFALPIDSFEVVDVRGLPNGIAANCDDPDCRWTGQSPSPINAFIELIGSPGNNPSGKYPIYVDYKYHVTIFGSPQVLNETDSSMTMYVCPFFTTATNLEMVQSAPTLNLTTVPSSGYYFGFDGVLSTAIVTNPTNAFFLSTKEVLLNPNFTVDAGAQFLAGTCPE